MEQHAICLAGPAPLDTSKSLPAHLQLVNAAVAHVPASCKDLLHALIADKVLYFVETVLTWPNPRQSLAQSPTGRLGRLTRKLPELGA